MQALLAPLLLMRAASLRAGLAGTRAVSRRLIARGRERRLTSTYPLLRPIGGGSDAALVAVAITGASLCLPCIAKKTGVPEAEADTLLLRIATTLRLGAGAGRCDSCLEQKTTFRLNRAGVSGGNGDGTVSVQPANTALAVWRYLEAHRGQMFCTQCLARALGIARRLDRAVIAAEGRGARRRYAPCVLCGKDRLLCGLS